MESGIEKHWRVKELAQQLGVSPQTVRRIFEDRPGVKIYGDRYGTKHKQRYRTILIPDSVVQQVKRELE